MYSIKYHLPLHDVREVLGSKLFTEHERGRAVNRILKKWQSNSLFSSVLAGETTFERHVRTYVEDNAGLGLFKRWKLISQPSPKFIEDISALFDVEMWYMIGRGRIINHSLISTVIRPAIRLPLAWVLPAFACVTTLGTLIFSGRLAEVWGLAVVLAGIATLSTALVCFTADDPFREKRDLAKKLLADAKELDKVVQKYWVSES